VTRQDCERAQGGYAVSAASPCPVRITTTISAWLVLFFSLVRPPPPDTVERGTSRSFLLPVYRYAIQCILRAMSSPSRSHSPLPSHHHPPTLSLSPSLSLSLSLSLPLYLTIYVPIFPSIYPYVCIFLSIYLYIYLPPFLPSSPSHARF
jgi:hypothetical protein